MKMRSSITMISRVVGGFQRRLKSSSISTIYNSSLFDDPWTNFRAPVWNQLAKLQHEESVPKIGKNGYQVSVDVDGFKPNELSVKTVNDNAIVIEGKSEQLEEKYGSFFSRHFIRKYALPAGFDASKAISTLSSDGVLTINIPLPHDTENEIQEREIPIQQTGPAHLNIKENPVVEEELNPQNVEHLVVKENQPEAHTLGQRIPIRHPQPQHNPYVDEIPAAEHETSPALDEPNEVYNPQHNTYTQRFPPVQQQQQHEQHPPSVPVSVPAAEKKIRKQFKPHFHQQIPIDKAQRSNRYITNDEQSVDPYPPKYTKENRQPPEIPDREQPQEHYYEPHELNSYDPDNEFRIYRK